MEPTKAEDENAEENGYKSTCHASPIFHKDFIKDIESAQVTVFRIISDFIIVDDKIAYAQRCKQNDRKCQVYHKNVEQATYKRNDS